MEPRDGVVAVVIGRAHRTRIFARGDYVRFYLPTPTKTGAYVRDGMVMEDEDTATEVVVRDLHSQYAWPVPAGHVWGKDGVPGDEPEVSVSWSDDGLNITCTRKECMVWVDRLSAHQRLVWWTQEVPGNHVLPERLQYLVDEHIKTH